MITIRQLIRRKPVTLPNSAKIDDAAKLMVKEKVGLVVLTHPRDRNRLMGVVSERDVIRGLAQGLKQKDPVTKISTKRIVTILGDYDVGKAANLFTQKDFRHLVVLDEKKKLIGVISVRDLIAERETLKAIVSSYEEEPVAGVD